MQRLGKNRGRYEGEVIDVDQVASGIHQAATVAGWECDDFFTGSEMNLRAYRRAAPKSERRVYISAGIHGDEPSGPVALLHLLEENRWPEGIDFWLVPLLNPTGFRRNSRENSGGIDLNREYRNPRALEIVSHVSWLERQPNFDLMILLHEDWEANGFYVYEVNPDDRPSLAEGLIESVRPVCPIETAATVDDFPCQGGIIRPRIPAAERPLWAEAIYLLEHKTRHGYNIETPSDFPLPLRVKTHAHAVRSLLSMLAARTDSAGQAAAHP